MLGVVPGEEGLAEGPGLLDDPEALRKLGPVLERLELRLGERVIVGDVGARQVKLYLDTGAYSALGEVTLRKATLMCVGPYRIPNVDVQGLLIYTNNTVSSAMRGFGVPQACFAWESHTETIARRLGMDSLKFRMLNAYEEGDTTPGGQILANVGLKTSMREAMQAFGWNQWGSG